MNMGIMAFLISTGAVVLAEMGDKTQLLAMAFASKYKAKKVLIGVFIATVLNHALAVAVGHYVTQFKTLEIWIQVIASISFVLFGLWTIRGDKIDDDDAESKYQFGPIITVAIAFFIAELGDKTQLATIALATRFPQNPVFILMGTTTGMMIADAIGIIFGVVMCKRIPETMIKMVSAGAFMLFGYIGFIQVLLHKMNWSMVKSISMLIIVILISGYIALRLIKNNQPDKKTDIKCVNNNKEEEYKIS